MKTSLLKLARAELKAFETFTLVKTNIAGSADVYQLIAAKKLMENAKIYVSADQYQALTEFFEFTRQRMTIKKSAFIEVEHLETEYA